MTTATFVGPAAQSAANVDLLTGIVNGWYDTNGYASFSVQVIGSAGIAGGAVTIEQTNDPTLAPSGVAYPAQDLAVINAGAFIAAKTIAASTVKVYGGALVCRYVRVRISTAFTGGTVQAVLQLSDQPFNWTGGTVQQDTAANLNAMVVGTAAEDAAATSSGVVVAGVVRTATSPTTLVAGDSARMTMTSGGAVVNFPWSVPDVTWQFTGVLTTNTASAMKAAGAAGIRNYVTGISFQNTSATATTVLIQDNVTTIAQFNAPASMTAPSVIPFPTPIRGTAATVMNVICGTTGANVLVNAQGFQAA